LVEKIKRRRLLWFGHVERLEGERLPIAALYMNTWREREAEGGQGKYGWTISGKTWKKKHRLNQD